MRLAAIQDQWRRVNCRSDRRETGTQIDQIRKTENRIEYQIRKPAGIFAKTENQMLNNGKSANLNEYKNRKTDLKNSQNRKNRKSQCPPQAAILERRLFAFVLVSTVLLQSKPKR